MLSQEIINLCSFGIAFLLTYPISYCVLFFLTREVFRKMGIELLD